MKQLIFAFVLLISCLACANNRTEQAERRKDMKSTKEIYLAGGCFWGTEHFLKLIEGVEATQVGYANGNIANPTYKQVCTGTTDFAETVKVQYDPAKVDLPFLIDLYFKTIDPTSVTVAPNIVQVSIIPTRQIYRSFRKLSTAWLRLIPVRWQ